MRAVLPDAQELDLFVSALQEVPPTSLRLHPLKNAPALPAVGWSEPMEAVAWAQMGRYLASRPSFTRDPLFHAGAYYVQEASSMFVERIWLEAIERQQQQRGNAPLAVLDLCAAPGGKTTHALSLLPEDSLVVCNEIIDHRAQILAENVQKWGMGNVVVCQNSPEQLAAALPDFFDIILVDAPCSGEGMFRKDADSILEWSTQAVGRCVQRQREILRSAWAMLRRGGVLIYSTCTYNRAENEENLQWWLQQAPEAQPLQVQQGAASLPYWGVQAEQTASGVTGYRFFPHRLRGEGFFVSFMAKGEGGERADAAPKGRQKSPIQWLGKKQAATCAHLLRDASRWLWHDHRGMYRAFDRTWGEWYGYFYERLRVVYAGISVAEVQRSEIRPQPALALHTAAELNAFARVELTLEQAQSFLRLADFDLSEDAPRGWLLAMYAGRSLGWLKNLGSRHNNYYPKNWRIRMEL